MNYCKLIVSSITLSGLVSLPLIVSAESLAGSRSDIPVQDWPINYSRNEMRAMLLETLPSTEAGTNAKYQPNTMKREGMQYQYKDSHQEDKMKSKSQQRAYEYKRKTFDE